MADERPRRVEARRGFSVSYRGKTLLSLIDPEGQARRIAEAAPVLDRTLYFCPSPLYGYGLERLLERMGPGSAALCVEADKALMALSVEALPELLRRDTRLRLAEAGDAAALCGFVRDSWGGRRFRRLEVLRFSGGWQLSEALYDELAAALRREMAVEWGNAMTLIKLGRRYARNALRNLPLLVRAPPVGALDYGEAPVLVLGAGPSLDPVLDGVAARFGGGEKRPFRIIAVDTALQNLKARRLRPDLAVALESQHWNLGDFIGLCSQGIPLAMDLSALPAGAGALGDGLFLFVTPWTELRLFARLEAAGLLPTSLAPLGSVGLSAVELARRLSRGPVLVGGIDFSFIPGASHARSTPSHLAALAAQDRFHGLIRGEGFEAAALVSKSGFKVRSAPGLRAYRDLFEQEFAADPRLQDIEGSGLSLGLHSLSLDAALDLLASGGAPSGGGLFADSGGVSREGLHAFMRREREALICLRDSLSGGGGLTETLLDEADYLWAHFPECAAAGGRRPPMTDLSFLKRVRAELDPFIKLWDMALAAP